MLQLSLCKKKINAEKMAYMHGLSRCAHMGSNAITKNLKDRGVGENMNIKI
jgi:hypothetical protein